MKKAFLFILIFLETFSIFAQEKTFRRRYVPIVVQGSQLPTSSLIIDQWRAYRYETTTHTWQLVPSQVDEKDTKQRYHRESDGILDSNDELVFMPEDLGDRAPLSAWPNEITNSNYPRVELEFSEYAQPAQKGWIYLFHSQANRQGYLDYVATPVGSIADTVKTPSYHVGHNRDGWIDYISLANDFNKDLIDRFKLRIAGETAFGNIGKYAFTEDTLNNTRSTYYRGLIRGFHKIKSYLTIPQIQATPFDVDYDLHYYPYSITLGVSDVQLENPYYLVLAGAKLLRQSLDFNSKAVGMFFYSDKNRSGVKIDGKPDQIDVSLPGQSGDYWLLATGAQGTIMMVCEMPNIKNTVMKIYYRDSLDGTTGDGTPDSGDMVSFGDMGISITGGVIVTNRVTLRFTVYLLSQKQVDPAFADSLFFWDQHAPEVVIREQYNPGTAVESHAFDPSSFHLSSPHPNPFNPEHNLLQWRLSSEQVIPEEGVAIFNIRGQQIAKLDLTPFLSESNLWLRWDGRDGEGKILPPGLYLLTIRTKKGMLSHKVLMIY